MKAVLVVVLAVVALLVVFVAPVDAKRDDGSRRGCSSETHQLVVERDEPAAFKLCAFPKGDR